MVTMSRKGNERYRVAAHRMQSAVALDFSVKYAGMAPDLIRALKHLRVGINSAMVSQEGLARLLIEKGIFTEEEYLDAVTVAMEREADARTQEAREEHGLPDGVFFA
jgi:hypothetical protein